MIIFLHLYMVLFCIAPITISYDKKHLIQKIKCVSTYCKSFTGLAESSTIIKINPIKV